MNQQPVSRHLRETLMRFINRRERAYKETLKLKRPVPEYAQKVQAITRLRTQLSASRDWTLMQNIKWIVAMRSDITLLLPFEFHKDEKQRTYRKHITELLNYCEDSIHPNLYTNGNSN